ncbi:MAG: F510_1955 family glycosylhydrolase [Pseudomonadota bacterium]|jgi:photosystem II stability/assembly factor-like uncharacterized protein
MKRSFLLGGLVLALAAATPALAQVTLTHVHGLGYSADGKRLFVPSHHGLAVYSEGRWAKAPGPQHDYMGFAPARGAFYTSGHPAPGSGLINPFGLMKSEDGGATWRKLGLEGEADFHVMAVGYESKAVYVFNHGPNSRMRAAGLHATENDGFSWRQARVRGLAGEVIALAVHPRDAKTVAAATERGLYLSTDGGDTFRALSQEQTTSVAFDLDGEHLWAGGFTGQARLVRVAWRGSKSEDVKLPELGRDAVSYIAQNPAARSEYAIATFERSVFLSRDGGRSWTRIAERGRAG